MTDDNPIPEDTEGEMPEDRGDNFAKSEKALGAEAYRIGRHAEKLLNKHDKIVTEVHADIIAFGLKLQTGRDLYEFDNTGYNDWIVRSRLDTIRIGATQQERTACRTIARLHETGYVEDPDDENAIPLKLDLTECKRVRPTDIIKWARETQPLLFDDLRAKALTPQQPKQSKSADLEDEMPDLGGTPAKTAKEIAQAVINRPGISASEVEAIAHELLDWVKAQKKQKPAG
jgi:hypothetical protein